MTTELLQKKTARYLSGDAKKAEAAQIDTWLTSISSQQSFLSDDERKLIETEITGLVHAYAVSSQELVPKPAVTSWWEKIGL